MFPLIELNPCSFAFVPLFADLVLESTNHAPTLINLQCNYKGSEMSDCSEISWILRVFKIRIRIALVFQTYWFNFLLALISKCSQNYNISHQLNICSYSACGKIIFQKILAQNWKTLPHLHCTSMNSNPQFLHLFP